MTLQNQTKTTKKLSEGTIIPNVGYTVNKGVVGFSTATGEVYTTEGANVIITDIKKAVQYPQKVRLVVPYLSQMDNQIAPSGSCNVTCVAMVLKYYGIHWSGVGQLEDELNRWLVSQGLDRHSHDHLNRIFAKYGIKNTFKTHATLNEIKFHLATNNPVIVAGYQTTIGHISVAVGYDENGMILHDPYGDRFEWGYEVNNSRNGHIAGQYNHYSHGLFKRLFDFNGIWAHFPQKPV